MSNKITIPQTIQEAWNDRKGPIVFSTVSEDAVPNSIYATCVSIFEENSIIVANNFFNKTMKNITSGSKGVILFITNEDKAFQVKGHIEYVTEGKAFDDMKKWNPERLPGHGAAILVVEEIFSGAEKLV
ncbi:pyridoxamine 5-phosphate oxidase [Labilibaculum filiforme]|uniref:Pyridoxamine 5-phosphate oxidase n=1 Tax=Labilibaculum filiforme TaxID=1940526 RepID=A0A2N3HSW0_9BACT|nr:pyridoxamine 5'-phosphate oxidase family protein [Labilibaculum filiforme]PKQ61136.1 pyridoxamine 5-phosphate oxidase [Labilibaculum filiforme]